MKIVIAIIIGIAVAGCTTVKQKYEAYEEVASGFTYPDKVVACYKREGDAKRGFEARCFGQECEVPECPQ